MKKTVFAPFIIACTCAMAFSAAAQSRSSPQRGTTQAQPEVSNQYGPIPPVPPLGSSTAGGASLNATAQKYSANTNGEPDVFLDVPNLSVEQVTIEVDKLQVHLALDARLGNLLKLTAGADASVDKVKIDIKGVKAQVQLRVHLANVAAIIDRTLTTVDRNPQLITRVLGTVDNAVGTVGGVANNAVGTVGGVANGAVGAVAGRPTSTLLTPTPGVRTQPRNP